MTARKIQAMGIAPRLQQRCGFKGTLTAIAQSFKVAEFRLVVQFKNCDCFLLGGKKSLTQSTLRTREGRKEKHPTNSTTTES
jgi:hypothetical protein